MSTNVAVGGDFFQGNYNALSIDTKAEIKNDSSFLSWNINPSFIASYLLDDNKLLNREGYVFSDVEKRFGKWKIIAFNENEHSYNKHIDYRGNLAFGCAYKITAGKYATVDISEAVLPEAIFIDHTSRVTLRMSTRLKFQYQREWFKFTSITLAQPSIYTAPSIPLKDNFILRTTNLAEFTVTKSFSTGMGLDVSTQTYPAYVDSKVKPTDTHVYFFFKVQI